MEKEAKTLRQQLGEGQLLVSYSEKYVLSINDASDIDRVRWSIVVKGTNGKEHLDFYMKLEDMRQMYDSFNDKVNNPFIKKIMADKDSKIPSAYPFTGGKKGHLKLNIGGGRVGLRVQISTTAYDEAGNIDKSHSYYYSTAVSIPEVKTLFFNFGLCYGLVPVSGKTYYGQLVTAFNEGISKRAAMHRTYDADAIADSADV